MSRPPLRIGDRVIDRRTGQAGTFNRWQVLMGRQHALVAANGRRWWIPEADVFKPLSANTLARKRRRAACPS